MPELFTPEQNMANVDITLKYKADDIRRLFSYPANCHEVCFVTKTLEETISYYVNMSLERDGFTSRVLQVKVAADATQITLEGPSARAYATLLPKLLDAGKIGLAHSQGLNPVREHGQVGWRYNWRFFLPLGVAMANHKTVQLLHFPPDSVLERDEDYLKASTTKQWAALLAENLPNDASGDGATPVDLVKRTALYQNIIDLAPIAAPSNDGSNIDTVYLGYEDYFLALMSVWLKPHNRTLPMVAFGSAVHKWVQKKIANFGVHSVGALEINGLSVMTLGSNHPSYIFNADDKYRDDPHTPVNERLVGLILVLWEDLVTAYWQVHMAEERDATLDVAQKVLQGGIKLWSTERKLERLAKIVKELKLATFVKHDDQFDPAVKRLKELLSKPDEMDTFRKTHLNKLQAAIASLDSRSRTAIQIDRPATAAAVV
jgi:hypothetical protein